LNLEGSAHPTATAGQGFCPFAKVSFSYVLTMSVYAFAFGHYVAFAFGVGPWIKRGLAISIMAVLVGLNLLGTGKISSVERVIVAGNLIILIGLGVLGLAQWNPVRLVAGVEPRPIWGAGIGAASIFMGQDGVLFSKTLAYPHASEVASVAKTATGVSILVQEGTAILPAVPLSLEIETVTDVFTVGGLNAPNAIEVVVAPTLKRNQ
jgi:hypothetical protein